IDDQGNAFQVGRCFDPINPQCSPQLLRKCAAGTDLWDREVTPDAQAILARDGQSNVYLAGSNGMLAQYSNTGDLVWSNNFARASLSMTTDGSGNGFVSFTDGAVVRLQSDGTAQPPQISSAPSDQTAFSGDYLTFSVTASGTTPLLYQ